LVEWTERLIRALAVALRDPDTHVRQDAGVALFISGREAEVVVPELIEALADPDLKVRRLAAAALSLVGPPAKEALPTLAQLRNAEDDLLRVWVAEAERSLARAED
jgi:HEAT repeat protein